MDTITTRTNGADFYSIFAGTGITSTYATEFDVTTENYGDDYGSDGDDYDDYIDYGELDELLGS